MSKYAHLHDKFKAGERVVLDPENKYSHRTGVVVRITHPELVLVKQDRDNREVEWHISRMELRDIVDSPLFQAMREEE